MAFVKVRKGNKVARVSMNVYKNIYKKNGYVLDEEQETKVEQAQEYEEEVAETEEDEQEIEDIETIPISEMNKEQLAEYAKKHDIDTSRAKSVRDARNIVKEEVHKRSL